ncbi:hypothetical protein BJM39_30985, partial [Salmonella enterica subsp. enterica serovar Javiana]
ADPLTDRGSRSALDAELVRLERSGLWVSAEPEVITLFGTKDVLVTTRAQSWGSDTVAYPTMREFRERFPSWLAEHGSLVVKADRGNGGRTVWNVTLLSDHLADVRESHHADPPVMVQHARLRDDTHVLTTLQAFMESCSPIYSESDGRGHLVVQPYEPRISEGLVRCYLVQDRVVGFALQNPPETKGGLDAQTTPRQPAVFGLPSPKTMLPAGHPNFEGLRGRLEHEWIPQMCEVFPVSPDRLPLLWDIDLIRGTPTVSDPDPFVLCEINVS